MRFIIWKVIDLKQYWYIGESRRHLHLVITDYNGKILDWNCSKKLWDNWFLLYGDERDYIGNKNNKQKGEKNE